ncbi:hypothetical protein Anas_05457 [Armadillidium nasatum]|uniref:Transmembrane protein n=1 Tax=Armadillidium nasatum TaxID=96803 RepID=A0A5N5SV27_9CRUS|nr:hypothetical protein Anas_05457 [Armadillidium nasatum]
MMNPSNSSQESQDCPLNNDVNLQFDETESPSTQRRGNCNCGSNKYCIVFQKLLFIFGSIIILIFLFGFFGIHTEDNAETLLLITAGIFIILGTYIAGKRYRLTLLEPPNSNERREQIIQNEENTVYILSIPDGNIHPFTTPSVAQNVIIPGVHAPNQVKKDSPPRYEDVVAPPPPYETLNAGSLKF